MITNGKVNSMFFKFIPTVIVNVGEDKKKFTIITITV